MSPCARMGATGGSPARFRVRTRRAYCLISQCVRPALADSYEALFHDTGLDCFLHTWRAGDTVTESIRGSRLERAIGVIYLPETERLSHYFGAQLPDQFDAVLHFDETQAVEPLEYTSEWEVGEAPETFPFKV